MTETVYWLLISILFIISFIGLIYPIIPSVLFIFGGFLLYGFLFSFYQLTVTFWVIQIIFVILLFGTDYLTNLIGVKKYGGSKAAIWGSTIGLLIGPFIIPVAGILIGPFVGAIAGEMFVNKKDVKDAFKIGIGSLIGLLSGVIAKGIIQLIMIAYFLFLVL
jgi:uncharacterized protein